MIVAQPTQTYIKRGDLKPDLVYYAWDAEPDPTKRADLSLVASWRLIGYMGASLVFNDTSPAKSAPDADGRVALTHAWTAGETATVGRITVEAEAMWPGGKPQTFPAVTIDVKPDLG